MNTKRERERLNTPMSSVCYYSTSKSSPPIYLRVPVNQKAGAQTRMHTHARMRTLRMHELCAPAAGLDTAVDGGGEGGGVVGMTRLGSLCR